MNLIVLAVIKFENYESKKEKEVLTIKNIK
jgi:hypothetical protein